MKRIFIASTDKKEDFKKTKLDGVQDTTPVNEIKEYKNGNIEYNGKIYKTVKKEDCKKQLMKILGDKFKKGLDKIDHTNIFKSFLERKNYSQAKALINNIADKILNDQNSLENIIDGHKGEDYVFFPRRKSAQQSEEKNDNDDLEQIKANLQEAKKTLSNDYNTIVNTFKTNMASSPPPDLNKQLEKASDELQKKINKMLQTYNQQIENLKEKYRNTNNQAFKKLQQQTKKLVQKIQNNEVQQIEQFVQKLKKIEESKKSKFEKLNIDTKEEKIKTIEKMKGGNLVKILNSGTYSLIKSVGRNYVTVAKDIKDLNQSNYIKYDDIGFIRVVSNGEKSVINIDTFDKIDNAFIVDLSSLNEDFVAENFIINKDGKYIIYNRGSKTEKETCDSVRKLKQYIRQNYESDQSDIPEPPQESRFNVQEYATGSDSEKDSYLSGFPDNIQIKQSDFSDFGIDDRLKVLKQLWEKGKTIKISRRNRHLSLQQLALNTIFKHLK